MVLKPRAEGLPDAVSDSVTGTTTNSYVSCVSWVCWGFTWKTLTIKNTHATNSLLFKVLKYTYPDGNESIELADAPLDAGDTATVIINDAFAEIIVQVKSEVSDTHATYQVDYLGEKGQARYIYGETDTTTTDIPKWGDVTTGTLNDANLTDEIKTSDTGALCWIGASLENMQNGDDFDIEVDRYDGSAWRTYKKYNVTMSGSTISIDTGGGAVAQNLDELNLENIYLDSTRKLRLKLTKNSVSDRDFPYFYNKQE